MRQRKFIQIIVKVDQFDWVNVNFLKIKMYKNVYTSTKFILLVAALSCEQKHDLFGKVCIMMQIKSC